MLGLLKMTGAQIKRPEKNKSTTMVFKKRNPQARKRQTRRKVRSRILVYRKNREKNPPGFKGSLTVESLQGIFSLLAALLLAVQFRG